MNLRKISWAIAIIVSLPLGVGLCFTEGYNELKQRVGVEKSYLLLNCVLVGLHIHIFRDILCRHDLKD